MAKMRDPELVALNVSKANLIRQYNKKEISEEEYNKRVEFLQEGIDRKVREYMESVGIPHIPQQMEVPEMVDNKEKGKEKKERKVKEDSNAQLILKALQMKSVKTYEEVAKKVKEWKPVVTEPKIKAQAKTMIKEISQGKGGKAKKYTWKEEDFLLELVE